MAAISDYRTVSFTFSPAPIDLTSCVHDYFELLYREALRGTSEHFRAVTLRARANGRPLKSYSLSRDAKLMLAPEFAGGPNAKKLPGPGCVLKCTTSATFIGNSYYRNESVFTFEQGGAGSEAFTKGQIIAGSSLGFVFVEMTEKGGWTPSKCPEELAKGGWTVKSPLEAIPQFAYLTRDEPSADKYLSAVSGGVPLPDYRWTVQFNQTDSFGHHTARKRVYPFFDFLASKFPNKMKREAINPRGINVAANSVLGYYVEFKTELKFEETASINAVVAPASSPGLVEIRFTLEGDQTKGVLNRASMLLVSDNANAPDLLNAVPTTGRGRVMAFSVL